MSHRRKSILSGFAPLLLTIILISTGRLRAQETAVVLLEPQSLTLSQGQTRRIVVRIEGAADVYGVQIDLVFDANQIRVLDADENRPGVQILAGDFLTRAEGFEAANEVNNETGHLLYAYSRLAPAESVSGSGILFEFEVEALETGSIELQLGPVIVGSPEGDELPVQVGTTEGSVGAIFVPNFTATAPGATAVISTDSPTSEAPTAEITPQPTITAEFTEALSSADSPTTASMVLENTLSATETQTAAPILTPGELPTSTISAPLNGNEAEPAANVGSSENPPIPAATTVEIAAAPVASEEKNAPLAAEDATPALTVIGQNQRLEDTQAQSPTPAPAINSEGRIEGIYLAIGLIALSVGLIAIWFLMRIKPR